MHAHDHPFGSARFASEREVRRAFSDQSGLPFGFSGERKLTHSKNAGMLLIGGAGSGKFTSVLAHMINARGRGNEPLRCAIFDPKREMRQVLEPWFAHIKAAVYEINAYSVHGVSGHPISLLSHLGPYSTRLVADSRQAARTLFPENPNAGGDDQFFRFKAQNWVDGLMRGLVHLDGSVSPASLFKLIGIIRSDQQAWNDMATLMTAVSEPDVGVTFKEMLDMARDAERTFHSVMGEIGNGLSFMTDPTLQRSFVGSGEADFSLEVLCENSSRPVFVFFVMPPELIVQNAALIRLFFSALRIIKQQRPQAPTLNLIIDEAAQLGRFPEIADFFSIGRGFGLSPVVVYQDLGQIAKNLGPTGAMTLSASADLEVYLGGGIADLETAHHLSRKLGNQTLVMEDHLTQERAKRARSELIFDTFAGKVDPLRAGSALRALDYEQQHKRKQARALMSPDEILRLPSNMALVMPSSYGIPPYLADKRPYFERSEYTGLYGPNPYFDRDMGTVSVPGWPWRKRLKIERESVPSSHADLPQYAHGEWAYVKGYRPKS
ncbi:type IV secretory system conjugative DNA transfer family protein [Shimia sp. R9_3]|uniref:type IV secretory system conjugative DNA transfer family protein n=1 Tax=Shimia sp. R9_3 TaxID=2821113 RepID=UPI001ADD00EB|nr:type IV secretory system conjugative DNA transfer family protein [Shimia sp. R9_3]MBO9403122.1 type IV secretory system conjugative DNA transfer family protein [Shimia sp. R9_3]